MIFPEKLNRNFPVRFGDRDISRKRLIFGSVVNQMRSSNACLHVFVLIGIETKAHI